MDDYRQEDVIPYRGLNIVVMHDDDPMNPREWDNLGKMLCNHNRYELGDERVTHDELAEIIKTGKVAGEPVIWLPLYLLDHSGLAMRTGRFPEDPGGWDSGVVGLIFVSKRRAREEYGWKRLSAKRVDLLRRYLTGEVETYSDYLEGDVHGFTIETEDELLDGNWGYYGWENVALALENEIKPMVDALADEREAEVVAIRAIEIGE